VIAVPLPATSIRMTDEERQKIFAMNASSIHEIGKTSYLRGLQCARSLVLHRRHPELRDTPGPGLEARALSGKEVERCARSLFPGGVTAGDDVSVNPEGALRRTRELIEERRPVLYEAAFLRDGVICVVDILVLGERGWRAFEVKSGTGMRPSYIDDVSLQYLVMRRCGLPVESFSLLYLNRNYVRTRQIEPRAMFIEKPVLERAIKNLDSTGENIEKLKRALGQPGIPEADIGERCFAPYRCDFISHCWGDVPEDSVFDLTGFPRCRARELYCSGIRTIADIPPQEPLTEAQRIQRDCVINRVDHVDVRGIAGFVNSLNYPLLFMDFEAVMPAVPLYERTSPYQHIPFQYSVHSVERPGAGARHREFLSDGKGDPRREFAMRLIEDTRGVGDIIVYGEPFERSVLLALAAFFPEWANDLRNRAGRLRDLMLPFRNHHYYTRAMKGHCSLKRVLPALVPGAEYGRLAVCDGFAAQRAFLELVECGDCARAAGLREGLREYCALDTLGMALIVERMRGIAQKGETSHAGGRPA
jgi:hypothetical protein